MTNINPAPFLPSFPMLNFTASLPILYLPSSAGGWGLGACGLSIITPLCRSFLRLERCVPGTGQPLAISPRGLLTAAPAAPWQLDTCTQCNAFAVKGQFLCFIELRPRPEVIAGFGPSSHGGWPTRKLVGTLGKWKARCAWLEKIRNASKFLMSYFQTEENKE